MNKEMCDQLIMAWDELPNESLVCPKIAAKLLSVSIATLAKNRMNGVGIGYYKIGGSVRYKKLDLDEERKKSEFAKQKKASQVLNWLHN